MRSPCIHICKIDPASRHCLGCGRSLAEIEAWPRATETEQARILAAAQARLGR